MINFVLVLAKTEKLSIDFNKRILPAIKLHLFRDIHSLHDESVLLDSLQNPLPRVVIESILEGNDYIDEIFHNIQKRKMVRDKKRYHTISETDSQDFDTLSDDPTGNKTENDLLINIDRFSEDRLIDSELVLRKIHKNKRTSSSKQIEPNISIRRQDASVQGLQNVDSRLLMSSSSSMTRTNRPRGVLLAHLHEHKGAINKLIVVPGTTHFISCSNDATIKFWDCAGVSTKPQVLFRSKQTYVSPDAGAVTTISTCQGTDTLLALTENNNLHLLQLYSPSSQTRVLKTINFETNRSEPEHVTDVVALSTYNYATCSTSSNLRGYDLRLPTSSDVWNLKIDGSSGLITCMDGNEFCIACGTSSSVISMFDLRFYIRATSMSYPLFQDKMKKRIRRILLCNDEIYCSVDGNNEVSAWNCESASRTRTLWASPAPCLSSRHSSPHSVLGMVVDTSKETDSVITVGDDMKIRFWDLINPHRSYIVSRPPYNSYHKLTALTTGSGSKGSHSKREAANQSTNTYYQMKLVDGIQVIQETDKMPSNVTSQGSRSAGTVSQSTSPGASGGGGSSASTQPTSDSSSTTAISTSTGLSTQSPTIVDNFNYSTAHHDSISCLAAVHQSSLLLSASRDGVIKIWR